MDLNNGLDPFNKISDDLNSFSLDDENYELQVEENVAAEAFFEVLEEIGRFSFDENGDFSHNNRKLRYLSLPESLDGLDIDLNEGFHDGVRWNLAERRLLDPLLKWILLNRDRVQQIFDEDGTPIVTTFDTLNTMAITFHESSEWRISATKYKGVIYMTYVYSPEHWRKLHEFTKRESQVFYWKHKFRQLMTTGDHGKKDSGTNVNESTDIVLRSRLNTHLLMHSAEVGAEDPGAHGSGTDQFVKFAVYGPPKAYFAMEMKSVQWKTLMRYWSSAFFSGIPKVVCGFNDFKRGILKRIVQCETNELPDIAQGYWDPERIILYCDWFLSLVKETVVEDDPSISYVFSRKGYGEDIEIVTSNEMKVLPEWFISEF